MQIELFLSRIFEGLTRNYHYRDKKLSPKRKSFFVRVKKDFQAYEKVCKNKGVVRLLSDVNATPKMNFFHLVGDTL